MLLHVLMFWGLLARPAGRSDWPAENYPVRTWRVMRKAGAARRRLAEKLHPFSTHIALNCSVGKRLGLKESKSIENGIYQASPGSPMLIGVKGRGRGG